MSDIIKVKVSYPSKNEQNLQEFLPPNINDSLTSRSVLSLISHPESWEAYFIKWSISGEHPVGLKSHQDKNLGHSWVILYFTKGRIQKKLTTDLVNMVLSPFTPLPPMGLVNKIVVKIGDVFNPPISCQDREYWLKLDLRYYIVKLR